MLNEVKHLPGILCHVERSETSAWLLYKPSGDPSLTLRMTKGGAQDDTFFVMLSEAKQLPGLSLSF